MRGRNAAEKNNKYLQEMYNSLSDENNSLKLAVKSKESEIQNIRNMLNKFTNINDKLKSSVLKLEEQVVESRICNKCVLFGEKLELLEKCIKDLETEKLSCQDILMEKEDIIVNLQKEVIILFIANIKMYVVIFSNTLQSGQKYIMIINEPKCMFKAIASSFSEGVLVTWSVDSKKIFILCYVFFITIYIKRKYLLFEILHFFNHNLSSM